MDDREHLSSLRRGLTVLALLNRRARVTIAEVAQNLGLPRTTAHRIVSTLVLEGYVERVPNSRFYRLTPLVNMLSGGFSDEGWVSHVASPLLFEKTQQIGWPLSLATPFGEDMTVLVTTDQSTSLALDHFEIGFRLPIMYSSSGHVILAYASPEYRTSLVELLRRSDNPLQRDAHNQAHIDFIVEKVRAKGFEHIAQAGYPEASIAVPVLLEGSIVACLLVVYIKRAISHRDAEARFVPMLQDLATQIEGEVLERKRRLQSTIRGADIQAVNAGLLPVHRAFSRPSSQRLN